MDADLRRHCWEMQQRLLDLIDHFLADIEQIEEPQLKTMYETSVEGLGGSVKAFKDYERHN